MSEKRFFDFEVINVGSRTILLHVHIRDDYSFYMELFNFFFDEERILSYIENKTGIHFTPSPQNYVSLYRHLKYYIDENNSTRSINNLASEVRKILDDEYGLDDNGDGQLTVRLDKMGKIGEFMCSIILSEYFGYTCIIPKVNLTTDYNMNGK